jgi:hypothetical protein
MNEPKININVMPGAQMNGYVKEQTTTSVMFKSLLAVRLKKILSLTQNW